MSIDYHINPDDGLISMRADAALTIAELHSCGESLLADQAFQPELPVLIDLRGANLEQLCAGETLAPVFTRRFNRSVRGSVAVLVASDHSSNQLADVYRMICALEQAELFEDYDHALRWLIRREFAPSAEERAAVARAIAQGSRDQAAVLGEQPDTAGQHTDQ